jgi:hypothetical protein
MDVRYYPGWKQKDEPTTSDHTTALDLIEMAIQDVVSPDVTVAKCVDVHSFLTAWVTIHGSMRLSNEQTARMMVYYDDTVHHISYTE